ncbi:MAG: hypothetical protein QNK33_06800 [Bacteroidales bacterium]|nr:hypothetical protein [Bacteroidales bacterium]
MKKLTLGLITLVMMTISCEKEEDSFNDLEIKQMFEESAKLHTEAMDVILASLYSSSISKDEISPFIEKTASDFLESNDCLNNHNIPKQKIFVEECTKLKDFYNQKSKNAISSDLEYLKYTISLYGDLLSNNQKIILNKIDSLLSDCSSSEVIISELTNIKDVLALKLPAEERLVIYSATTIGIESVSYWKNNIDSWTRAIEVNSKGMISFNNKTKWFNWTECGKSDVAGAIGGAIAGGLVGAVAGGVGAAPGAVTGFVAGGIGSSVTDAAFQIIDHIFN